MTDRLANGVQASRRVVDELGLQTWFAVAALIRVPQAVKRHNREIASVLVETTFGAGALAVIGGTVVITGFMAAFAGVELGIQGFDQLSNLGVEALSGFVSAYINTRLGAPVIASITLVATIGAGFTAQLGAMRVSEEVDALEVMAIPTLPYLVSTRIVAGMVAIIPIYALALIASYISTRLIITTAYGQSAGAYEHYFRTFLIPRDIAMSVLTVFITSIVVMIIHCYYGFHASGGPAGVGMAVGRAVRLAFIVALCTNMVMSMALYGSVDTLHISGA